jgi:hypothetical protein
MTRSVTPAQRVVFLIAIVIERSGICQAKDALTRCGELVEPRGRDGAFQPSFDNLGTVLSALHL